jgi:DNA-3-methyladenine glycosylase I
VSTSADVVRCWPTTDEAYAAYHDDEWGRPVVDERGLYERLCLEGFQSGLSWLTILRKRENFRRAFAGFEPDAVARFGARDISSLLEDAGIVRHRGKIEAAIANARGVLALREAGTPLPELLWSYRSDDARLARALEAAESGRLPVRRPDDRLLDDAGVRDRQRPSPGVPCPCRGRGRQGARDDSSRAHWHEAVTVL